MLIPTYLKVLPGASSPLELVVRKVLLSAISTKQMLIPTYFQGFVRDQFTFGTNVPVEIQKIKRVL